MAEIDEKFKQAAQLVQTLTQKPDNNTLLNLYSLFKQGSEGDVTGSRPGMLNVVGRAKYDAWQSLKGKSKSQAQEEYTKLVNELLEQNKK